MSMYVYVSFTDDSKALYECTAVTTKAAAKAAVLAAVDPSTVRSLYNVLPNSVGLAPYQAADQRTLP